ncbi:MAG TPA: penicillin-binding transpeptidase domain-containing protein [Kofleriaceae bacterium]|nr:penicillin-binding transpeptidase domain-containing protein [Kofleriaceae bacterium]
MSTLMYVQKRKRLRRFGLLALLALAGAAGIAAGDDPKPSLEVKGGKGTKTAEATAAPVPADPIDAALASRGKLVGDAALRGALDLSKMEQAPGGGYFVPLPKGRRAILTLDPAIQEEAEKLLKRAKAPKSAIVVMKPDGTIVALAGRMQGPPIVESAPELATTVWAPAASVFKLVTAHALLAAGVGPDDPVRFHGGIRSVMKSNLEDDRRDNRADGSLSFAVAESNNAIMGKLAHRHLDQAKMQKAARAFGLGTVPAWAIEAEPSRVAPPDGELEFAQFAAGFDGSFLSAVDGALLANTVATGGMKVTPHIVAAIVDEKGSRKAVAPGPRTRAIPEANARAIGKMMERTIESGTGQRAFSGRRPGSPLHGIKIAGKTGSLSIDKPTYLGISWFVAYAPAEKPEYAIAVVFGNAELWWLKANLAARLLLERAMAVTSGGAQQVTTAPAAAAK